MTTTGIPADNGVNVEALLGVRGALADTPEIAQFQWRSTVSWVKGTHSRSDVETFPPLLRTLLDGRMTNRGRAQHRQVRLAAVRYAEGEDASAGYERA